MVPISIRMKAIADLVPMGLSVADIGCDHGFVSIYLVTQREAPFAIAMDINEGPLLRAREHIEQYGLSNKISTRLSNGALELNKGECDAAVIAGMGGMLTIKILEESKEKFSNMKCFVLSPQSDIMSVRHFLWDNGYYIDAEDMVYDEGKYYFMMRCVKADKSEDILSEAQLKYGPRLIGQKHPVLKDYLEFELVKTMEILEKLQANIGNSDESRVDALMQRAAELDRNIVIIKDTLAKM